MNFSLLKGMAAVATAALVAGCGGGGGGGAGGTQAYTISLSADKTTLPLNIGGYIADIGSPYTTTVYVQARASNGSPIPDDDEAFACSITSGLDSGALYYLDGDDAHYTEVQNPDGTTSVYPSAYRSIVLGSNAGAATFHYHSTGIAGPATIRCSVQSPDNVNRSTSIDIQVGGTPSGKVSQVVFTPFSPNYLFVQGMNNYTQVQSQVWMVDEAGQLIQNPSTGTNNLEISIWSDPSTTAEDNATLRGVDGTGKAVADKSIRVPSINGQAQFTLVSGSTAGTITLEAVTDRADNNVDNGITERVSNLIRVSVLNEYPGTTTPDEPLDITSTSLPSAKGAIPYAVALEGNGGVPPYTWSLVAGSQLPSGLNLSTTGIIYGTPYDEDSGTYNFVVRLTDSTGAYVNETLSLSYTKADTTTSDAPPTVSSSSLSDCTVGTPCVRTLTASGGVSPYTWTQVGLGNGLSMTANGPGIITGTPISEGVYTFAVVAKGANNVSSSPRTVTLRVLPTGNALTILSTTLASGKVGTPYAAALNAVGGDLSGDGVYAWNSTTLPPGLSIGAATGLISGTPTGAATDFAFTVSVTDDVGTTVSKAFTITIAP